MVKFCHPAMPRAVQKMILLNWPMAVFVAPWLMISCLVFRNYCHKPRRQIILLSKPLAWRFRNLWFRPLIGPILSQKLCLMALSRLLMVRRLPMVMLWRIMMRLMPSVKPIRNLTMKPLLNIYSMIKFQPPIYWWFQKVT